MLFIGIQMEDQVWSPARHEIELIALSSRTLSRAQNQIKLNTKWNKVLNGDQD